MQKRGYRVLALIFVSTILLLGVVSAFSFSDFFSNFFGKGVTGNVVNEGCPSNLVAYYKFDGNASDSSGNGNNGNVVGSTLFTTGKMGQAFDFRGNNYVKNSFSGLNNLDSVTVSAWVRRTGSENYQGIVTLVFGSKPNWKTFGPVVFGYQGYAFHDQFFVRAGDSSGNNEGYNYSVNMNEWYHIVSTRDSNFLRGYVNGNKIIEVANTMGSLTGSSPYILIGVEANEYFSDAQWIGQIDEVSVYNSALSDSQISALYNNGNGKEVCSSSSSGGGGGGGSTVVSSSINCTDSDGGIYPYVFGYALLSNQATQYPDTCMQRWADSSWSVNERYCNSSNGVGQQVFNCSNGCSDGACITPSNTTTSPIVNCTDTEGLNIYLSGASIVTRSNGTKETLLDYCYDSNSIMESYCNGSYYSPYSGNSQIFTKYSCFAGCSNGACINQTNPQSCVDLDGNNIFNSSYVQGQYSNGSYFFYNDYCSTSSHVAEYICTSNYPNTNTQSCPNGCSNGACINQTNPPITNPVCSDLISEVKYPTSDKERTASWNYTYDGYEYVNGNDEHFTSYQASWNWNSPVYREDEMNYYYASYYVQVFDNQNIDLSNQLQWNKQNPACKATNYWINGQENTYYICNWDALNSRQSIDSYQNINRQISWVNGNVVVRMYLYSGNQLTDAEVQKLSMEKIGDLMNNLQNNEYKYIDWNNFNINYPMSNELVNALEKCKSDLSINESIYSPSWSCKTEPIICPEYGYQTRTCRSWNEETQKDDTQEEKIYCSPGICSGCYVSRWFGSVDKTCIPYGFRFGQETGKFQLFQENYTSGGLEKHTENFSIEETQRYKGDPYVEITPDNTLILRVEGWDNVTRSLVAGDEINLLEILNVSLHYQDDLLQYLFKVDYVYYDSENYSRSYFTYTAVMETAVRNYTHSYKIPVIWNMYCDIDGDIYQQKTTDYNNDWAKCQNNYECESNLCSYGECVELKAIAQEVSGIKGLFIRMLCKLSNLFDNTSYEQCIADYGVSA